jgi:transcription termination factor Rho
MAADSSARRPRKPRRTPKVDTSSFGEDLENFEFEEESPKAASVQLDADEDVDDGPVRAGDYADFDDSDDDQDDRDVQSEGEGVEESTSPGESSTDEGDRPKRRRRRRRRKGGEGRVDQNGQGSQGGFQGGHRSHGQQGRRDSNNRRGRDQSRGNNRGRMSKSSQNSASTIPVNIEGTFVGVLELHPKRYGFLRDPKNDYGSQEHDPFVSSSIVEKYNLREGVEIRGEVGPGSRGQGPRLIEIETIDGRSPDDFAKIKHFDNLTAINPFEQIKLETGPRPITMRVMDLLTPIGKGQRALIVAPPRSGKTMLLQDIANSVSTNHPEVHLIVLLIDERPEEVTDMRRMVKGEVIASSMDRDIESHVRISQLIFERGKRLAEAGKDCLILLDSITRTARAFNKWIGGGRDSKIGTGGLDVRALEIPRKMFGTARRFDEGGSLTVVGTALIDTGSRMDDAIFLEFKGTGNMEMVLSRELSDRRIWPAIDISKSGTRREEKLLDAETMEGVTMLRRALVSMNPVEAMSELTRKLEMFKSNREFLERIRSVL